MSKKCPPGILCIENMTLFMVVVIIGLVIYIITRRMPSMQQENVRVVENRVVENQVVVDPGIYTRARTMGGYTTGTEDVLLNPYAPPLRDQRVVMTNDVRGGVPINIATQSVDTNYRQVGLLTRLNGPQTILPLMGRPLFTNRDKWNFYTQSDQNNSVKLPITFKGRSCTNEYGCDDVSNGDTVYVEGYNDAFKVTIYDNAQAKYLPFI